MAYGPEMYMNARGNEASEESGLLVLRRVEPRMDLGRQKRRGRSHTVFDLCQVRSGNPEMLREDSLRPMAFQADLSDGCTVDRGLHHWSPMWLPRRRGTWRWEYLWRR